MKVLKSYLYPKVYTPRSRMGYVLMVYWENINIISYFFEI